MRCLTYLAILALSFACSEANSNSLALDAQTRKVTLGVQIEYLRDPGGLLSLDDIAAPSLRSAFLPGNENLNFGLTRDTVWLRMEVRRTADTPVEWWLEVAPAYIGELTMYLIGEDRTQNLAKPSRAGLLLPFSSREFRVRNSTFRINLGTVEPYTIYLKLRSPYPMNAHVTLWQPISYVENKVSVNILLGIYFGAFLIIFALCMMLWWVKRASTDFWWMTYIAAEAFMLCRVNGLLSTYIFPEAPTMIAATGIIAQAIMVWAGAHFAIHAFLLERGKNKFSYNAATWIGNLGLFIGLLRLFDASVELTAATFLLGLALCFLNCIVSWRFFQSGHPSAVYYFIATWTMGGCVILILARNFGIVQAYEFVDYVWQFNLVIHTGLISLGIVLMHRETKHEQARAAQYRANAEANLNLSITRKRLVALVSHEFRNALSLVSVAMHAINKTKDFPPDVAERHKNIVRVHRQMRRVIDDFLTEERIDGADLKLLYKKTEIRGLIEEIVSFGRMIGKNHLITFNVSGVPEYLWIDDGILRLILTNLVDNAVKYSLPGGNIFLEASFEDQMLKISVKDNGIGMTSYSLSQLFQPHFKADQHSEGMGMGLYMVKTMLNSHGGNIDVASKIGAGSLVEFCLKPQWSEEEVELKNTNELNDDLYRQDQV